MLTTKIKIIHIILALILLAAIGNTYEIKVIDGKIITNKYEYKGKPVWDDNHKSDIKTKFKPVTFSTSGFTSPSAKDSDFKSVSVSAEDQLIIDDLNNEGRYKTKTKVLEELNRRKTREYKDAVTALENLGISTNMVKRLLNE